jgi:myosin heavy subunit
VLRPALASSLRPCANLLELEELHEGAILNNLRLRYATDDIYTYISSIILSINPYKQLPCYGPSQIALYRKSLAGRSADPSSTSSAASSSTSTDPHPPHVYALADAAYSSLLRDQVNQAILISGESGAGQCWTPADDDSMPMYDGM